MATVKLETSEKSGIAPSEAPAQTALAACNIKESPQATLGFGVLASHSKDSFQQHLLPLLKDFVDTEGMQTFSGFRQPAIRQPLVVHSGWETLEKTLNTLQKAVDGSKQQGASDWQGLEHIEERSLPPVVTLCPKCRRLVLDIDAHGHINRCGANPQATALTPVQSSVPSKAKQNSSAPGVQSQAAGTKRPASAAASMGSDGKDITSSSSKKAKSNAHQQASQSSHSTAMQDQRRSQTASASHASLSSGITPQLLASQQLAAAIEESIAGKDAGTPKRSTKPSGGSGPRTTTFTALMKKRPYNMQSICGVRLDSGAFCTRPFNCKAHTRVSKRDVIGRGKDFEEVQRIFRARIDATRAISRKNNSDQAISAQHQPYLDSNGNGSKTMISVTSVPDKPAPLAIRRSRVRASVPFECVSGMEVSEKLPKHPPTASFTPIHGILRGMQPTPQPQDQSNANPIKAGSSAGVERQSASKTTTNTKSGRSTARSTKGTTNSRASNNRAKHAANSQNQTIQSAGNQHTYPNVYPPPYVQSVQGFWQQVPPHDPREKFLETQQSIKTSLIDKTAVKKGILIHLAPGQDIHKAMILYSAQDSMLRLATSRDTPPCQVHQFTNFAENALIQVRAMGQNNSAYALFASGFCVRCNQVSFIVDQVAVEAQRMNRQNQQPAGSHPKPVSNVHRGTVAGNTVNASRISQIQHQTHYGSPTVASGSGTYHGNLSAGTGHGTNPGPSLARTPSAQAYTAGPGPSQPSHGSTYKYGSPTAQQQTYSARPGHVGNQIAQSSYSSQQSLQQPYTAPSQQQPTNRHSTAVGGIRPGMAGNAAPASNHSNYGTSLTPGAAAGKPQQYRPNNGRGQQMGQAYQTQRQMPAASPNSTSSSTHAGVPLQAQQPFISPAQAQSSVDSTKTMTGSNQQQYNSAAASVRQQQVGYVPGLSPTVAHSTNVSSTLQPVGTPGPQTGSPMASGRPIHTPTAHNPSLHTGQSQQAKSHANTAGFAPQLTPSTQGSGTSSKTNSAMAQPVHPSNPLPASTAMPQFTNVASTPQILPGSSPVAGHSSIAAQPHHGNLAGSSSGRNT